MIATFYSGFAKGVSLFFKITYFYCLLLLIELFAIAHRPWSSVGVGTRETHARLLSRRAQLSSHPPPAGGHVDCARTKVGRTGAQVVESTTLPTPCLSTRDATGRPAQLWSQFGSQFVSQFGSQLGVTIARYSPFLRLSRTRTRSCPRQIHSIKSQPCEKLL